MFINEIVGYSGFTCIENTVIHFADALFIEVES